MVSKKEEENEMNHIELGITEGREAVESTPWLRWVDEVETLIGHSLDGDQKDDGYSLDYAYDQFASGVPAIQMATNIKD